MGNRAWLLLMLFVIGTFLLVGMGFLVNMPDGQSVPPSPPGWQVIRPPHDVFALAEQENILWAGGQEGVYMLDRVTGEVREELKHDPPLELVKALVVDRDGVLWVGHQTGLSRYKDGSWNTYSQEDGLPDNRVNALLIDQEERLWVGTWGGAAVRQGEGWQTITTADGLLDNMVNVMLQDSQGNMWFGSYAAPRGGISILSNTGDWQYFDHENGLPHNNVTSLVATRERHVWAGTGLFERGGACQFVFLGDKWEIIQVVLQEDGLAGEKIRSIFEDSRDVLWFGSEYDGIALLSGSGWISLNREDGISHPEIKVILQDVDKNIWLGTRDGITRISTEALPDLYGLFR